MSGRPRVAYPPRALKEIGKLDRAQVRRTRRFFEESLDLDTPRSRGQALVSRDEWRYRIGDYRILCHIDDHQVVVLVVKVALQPEVYR